MSGRHQPLEEPLALAPSPELDVERLQQAMQQTRHGPAWADFRRGVVGRWPAHVAERYARLSATEPGKPTTLSRTDPPRCDECGRVGYIVGVGADLRIGGHLDQRVKHPFRSGTEPGE